MSDAYDRMQRVSELAKLINGFPFDSSDFASDGDVPLVRIRDVLSEPFETYVPANVVPRNVLLRDDDVVIGMDGDFNSTLWRRGEAALNQRVCALRSVNGTDPRYLAYALPEHLKVINDLTWSTTVKHLTARQVRAIRLPEREAPEQRAIADFLDRETAQIDEFIAENERFIELLTERRAAVIAHALKGYDPTPLKYLVTPTRPMTYGILQCGDHVEGGVPYVGPSDIAGEGSIPAPSALRRTTPEIASEYRRSVLEGGDVVVLDWAGLRESCRDRRDADWRESHARHGACIAHQLEGLPTLSRLGVELAHCAGLLGLVDRWRDVPSLEPRTTRVDSGPTSVPR